VAALAAPTPGQLQRAAPLNQTGPTVDLDVLFIGAHPDDEAFGLAAYGQWNEYAGVEVGVITITRGEGGGNAVGEEEGPALGLIREAEERRAVGYAGIEHIYNLDEVDFYFNFSAPLTEEVWGHDQTLEKIVRVIRATRPEVIVTMDPSPNTHGHHQVAARLAIEAFSAAADSTAFSEQIADEGLQPWRVAKIFRNGASGSGPNGPVCASTFVPAEPTDVVYGVWSGVPSARHGGLSWAQVGRIGQREYASQGWAVFPDQPTDPTQLGCTRFTLIDSRVPYTLGNSSPTAPLEGAIEPAAGGLPLDTEFYLTVDPFDVVAGQPFTVTAHARYGGAEGIEGATVALALPGGWSAEGDGVLGTLTADQEATATFSVTPAAGAADGRARLVGTLTAGGGQGTSTEVVRVVPTVQGTLESLPLVAEFQDWADTLGVPQLDILVAPLAVIGSGESREILIDLSNNGDIPQSGSVTLELPEGFSADETSKPFADLAPEGTGSVTFTVTNTDSSLATANEGGDYGFGIVTTTDDGGRTRQDAAFNIVPVTTIVQGTTPPTVDGVESEGEYPGEELDLSRLWEGDDPESPEDAAGTAKVVWSGDALYLVIHVTDDALGTVLPPSDAKRHWRTDSVEITFDPRGDSENTSTTFKVGIFPVTDDTATENAPAAYRDADNFQGPIAETAPEMEIAAEVSEPYTGYTIEVMIPLEHLPAGVDPENFTMNIFIYDSDTQDLTGQTRLGWSTWGGVQGNPYRWGHADLDGYSPPSDRPTESAEPTMPLDVARSVDSPQSILQSASDGVPLGGSPFVGANMAVTFASDPTVSDDAVTFELLATGDGTANVFLWDTAGNVLLAEAQAELAAGASNPVTLSLDQASAAAVAAGDAVILVGVEAAAGGTLSLARDVAA
jgi:LmbE family N-acetylglucosaminyl deacetylase